MEVIEIRISEKLTIPKKTKEPEEISIALSVCASRINDKLTFVTAKVENISKIIGISIEDLECAAISAMFTGLPQVVAQYKQRDLAEVKLAQLQAEIPFIARSSHSFKIL